MIELPCKDGKLYKPTNDQLNEWAEAYPAVDVLGELTRMKAYLNAAPEKRPAKRMGRFIVNWLSRNQRNRTDKTHAQPRLAPPEEQQEVRLSSSMERRAYWQREAHIRGMYGPEASKWASEQWRAERGNPE